MQKDTYTTKETSYLTSFTMRQLDYWARKKMVIPAFQEAHGSGSSRLYTVENLVQLNIIRQLKKHGWSTQKIHKAIKVVKEVMDDPNPLKNCLLVHGKGTIFALSKTREGERILIDALSVTGQQVMSFVLETLQEEIRNSNTLASQGVLIELAHTGGDELCH
jgi:DNA-binding transcriptional MerR regulator